MACRSPLDPAPRGAKNVLVPRASGSRCRTDSFNRVYVIAAAVGGDVQATLVAAAPGRHRAPHSHRPYRPRVAGPDRAVGQPTERAVRPSRAVRARIRRAWRHSVAAGNPGWPRRPVGSGHRRGQRHREHSPRICEARRDRLDRHVTGTPPTATRSTSRAICSSTPSTWPGRE